MANINSNAIRFTINPDNNEEYACLHAITKAISVDGVFDLAELMPGNSNNGAEKAGFIAYDTRIIAQTSDHISLICVTRQIDAADLCNEVQKIYPYVTIDAATIYEENPGDMHMLAGDVDRLAEDIVFNRKVKITYTDGDTIVVPYIGGDNHGIGFFEPQPKPATTLYELYSCDEWRTTDTITARSRIIASLDKNVIAHYIYNHIDDYAEKYQYEKCMDSPATLMAAIENNYIDFVFYMESNLDEVTN